MGNKCTTPTTNPLFDDSNLNDYDKTVFNIKREKVFYGTIAICILYGSFALLLFILSYFSDKIKYLLLNSFLPFTIVYIIGTILIVMYLINQILNFKPYKLNRDGNYDSLSCPDYWVLERVYDDNSDNKNLTNYFNFSFESNAVQPELFKYRCVLNSNIFNTYDIFKASSNINNNNSNYTGKYHFFNVACNVNVNIADSNNDILSDRGMINNGLIGIKNMYPNQLYANVYYERDNNNGQYNKINTNIFKNNSNLYLKYEIAKAALLMNNYKILNYSAERLNSNQTYTDFYKHYTNNEITNDDDIKKNLEKLGVSVLNFDYNNNINTFKHANDNIIRLYKSSGKARICTRPNLINNRDTSTGTLNCSGNDADISSDSNGNLIEKLPLNCEKLYPLYMSTVDKTINTNDRNFDTNTMRCAYSKICGIPWSDMNCDKYFD